jgi:hypothetical protein
MKHLSFGKIAIATATFACTALLSFGWSEQRGVSLSIESAQARIGRPLSPVSVAGVARRQYRRGAGLAAGAIGTAAVAAASPWGYRAAYGYGPVTAAGYYGGDGGYYAASPWGDYSCTHPHAYECRPHAFKDWGPNWSAGGSGY